MAPDTAKDGEDAAQVSAWGTTVTQAAWKRLSSFSNDSSIPPSPRPSSAAVSQSNNSLAFSNTGSTVPMFPSHTPSSNPPNKLVKRNSSVRSTRSNSRLPIAVLKRPATSHQRAASLQKVRSPDASPSLCGSVTRADHPRTPLWKNYFVPKIASDRPGSALRRHSTGIPNPIKRVYPDRRYHPILLSGSEHVDVAELEVDEEIDDDIAAGMSGRRRASTPFKMTRRVFSNPLPAKTFLPSPSVTSSSFGQWDSGSVHESLPRMSTSTRSGNYDRPFLSSPRLSNRSFSPMNSPSETDSAEQLSWKRPSTSRLPKTQYRQKSLQSATEAQNSNMGNTQGAVNGASERPSKRRDVSGLVPSRRNFAKSRQSEPSSPNIPPLTEVELNLQGHSARTATLEPFDPKSLAEERVQAYSENTPLQEHRLPSSPTGASETSRPSRLSAAHSDLASLYEGSDNEATCKGDDGYDGPGDTSYYDSVRTRATSAGSNVRGLAIDKFFDDNRKSATDTVSPSYDHGFLKSAFHKDGFDGPRHSVIEEEDTMPTPGRSHYDDNTRATPDTLRYLGSSPPHLPSSPPAIPNFFKDKPTPVMSDDGSTWDFSEEEDEPVLPLNRRFPQLNMAQDRLSPFGPSEESSSSTTPVRGGLVVGNSIFDWSEQQPLEKGPNNQSPPRPRTVHGKKDVENRGSRAPGRRAPSAVHLRSQSVPVAPEVDGKRSEVVANKFGSWGVGTKGVTEDWNEDFDFEEPVMPEDAMVKIEQNKNKGLGAGLGMVVPKEIREQQTNVLANIVLLRDWGLLIEEMKDLKMKATQLRLLHEKMDMWHEVDAMIGLADQESNDQTLAPRTSPPSSPSFDYDAFDEPIMASAPRASPLPARRSMLLEDTFESPSTSPVRKSGDGAEQTATPRRPRKDSEAVARSVIEALQQKRNVSDPTPGARDPSQKVPFDTATLKRIVPYVQDLKDKVKKTIREAEGLHSSPQNAREPTEDPSFSRMFRDHPASPSASDRRSRRSTAATDNVMSDDRGSQSPSDDMTSRLKLMTVI
ncbi:hypothetical protein MBLNU457_5518t2 [Dothideomycetes sp. NU457]